MTRTSPSDLFRRLPSVDEILRSGALAPLERECGRTGTVEASRDELEALRTAIAAGEIAAAELDGRLAELPERIARRARRACRRSLIRVINAGGVIIHTNLGRVPLAAAALEAITECAGYGNLEFDLERGTRGRRDDHAGRLLARLFAREGVADVDSIVVNNNAAAVFLALAALARGGEVIVSRGELVEIGGSFRIPDIMAESGASLREVGTTNRTRIEDYERAIGENTRLLLRVHRSNFEIVGFTEQPELAELVALGRRYGLPVMEDLGSGALIDLRGFGIAGEPGLCDSLRAGVDLVTCSGDKLLGGPQAGLISGRPELVGRVRRHPLFRALRVDKLCFAALEATLSCYLRERPDEIPLLRMLARPLAEIERRCRALAATLPDGCAEVRPTRTMIGGGAAPGRSLPSAAVALAPRGTTAEALAAALRRRPVPIVSRIEDDRVLLDLRTVEEADDRLLAEGLAVLWRAQPQRGSTETGGDRDD
jgi:L-seryl-tRNA(Ser) seleniumtransferase